MLSYISQKFSKPSHTLNHEPRAALFLNRFSRTLTIMYATNGLADAIGIPANELCGKSFYYCIQENCLREAVKCLESAKANDSIAYLRFWFRDPRQDHQGDHDEHMSDGHSSGDEDDGGVHLSELMDHDGSENAIYSDSSISLRSSVDRDQMHSHTFDPNSRSSSGNSTDMGANSHEAIFDQPAGAQQSRTSSISTPDDQQSLWSSSTPHIELEAVVSCTSDGLVVVLRRAKPFVPQISHPVRGPVQNPYINGCFASPWASDPILPSTRDRSHPGLPHLQQPSHTSLQPTAVGADNAAMKGFTGEDFMNSIREVVVFAWALTGINGSLEQYTRGTPRGESQPPGGFPVWDPNANIERPIDRPYMSDTCKSSDLNHLKGRGDPGRAHSNGVGGQIQTNRYQGHAYSNGFSPRIQSVGIPEHTDYSDTSIKGHSNGFHRAGHDALVHWRETNYNPPSIHHDTYSEPNRFRTDQPSRERIGEPTRQIEEGSNVDGNRGWFG